ncbi:MAG: hypothetical protein AB7O81_06625 [Blastocatellales bacterium]
MIRARSGDHLEFGKVGRELEPLDDLDADEMVMIARRHYATGFPNPQRRGCPPPGEIVKVAGRGRAPDQSLLAHMFECSECFGEYRQALARYRDEVAVAPGAEWKRIASILTSRPVSAALILLLFFFGAGLILRKLAPDIQKGRIAHSTPFDAQADAQAGVPGEADVGTPPNQNAAPESAEITQPPTRRSAAGRASRASALPELFTVVVDLDEHRVLRGSQEEKSSGADEKATGKDDEKAAGGLDTKPAEEKVIPLRAARTRLVLRLPETAAAGNYTVSLVDPFDFVLLSRRAVSRDGVKLQVILDLRRVTPEKYRLRLSREGEAPAYYDVIIKKR